VSGVLRPALLACAFTLAPALASAADLPPQVRQALARAHVSARSSAFVVVPLDGGSLRLSENGAAILHPASTMKLLTTWAALTALGPRFQWRTEAWASGPVREGVLEGDLALRGGGDPSLVIERWWLLLAQLRALGLREIRGDLVVDRGAYEAMAPEASIDGEALRPYNVAPDALLVNFRSVRLRFEPDEGTGLARVLALPAPAALRLPATVPLMDGPCGDWHARLAADFTHPASPVFRGRYPRDCGARDWNLALLEPDEYLEGVFREAWAAAGGTLRGALRRGAVPAGARLLAEQDSPPLSDVIHDINKYSNNVMARQLFLALGTCDSAAAACREAPPPSAALSAAEGQPALRSAEREAVGERVPALEPEPEPAPEPDDLEPPSAPAPDTGALSPARSARFLRAWLARAGLPMPGLVLENGSGLSRREAIRAGDLARVLERAWSSDTMPDFLVSLPHAGVDGTMKSRLDDVPTAYIKTGLLSDARSVAGYVFAASGKRYAVVGIANGSGARAAQAAMDEFLRWVWKKG
jgi:D-alanyl-D-alanine carboxypeptidase/D-alanyl-D-alanine-endopeptidase (penicillin-binding protein 4)